MRLRPTWSLLLATPFGARGCFDINRSLGISIACAASTKILAAIRPATVGPLVAGGGDLAVGADLEEVHDRLRE